MSDDNTQDVLLNKELERIPQGCLTLQVNQGMLNQWLREKFLAAYDRQGLDEIDLHPSKIVQREFFVSRMVTEARKLLLQRAQAALDLMNDALTAEFLRYGKLIEQRAISVSPNVRVDAFLPKEQEIEKIWTERLRHHLIDKNLVSPKRGGNRQGQVRQPALFGLEFFYEALLPRWQESYEICRQGEPRRVGRDWRAEVKNKFPEFADDLIERLQPETEWPDGLADICLKTECESRAEDIALECAARLTGAAPDTYKMSTLKKTLERQQRQQRNAKLGV